MISRGMAANLKTLFLLLRYLSSKRAPEGATDGTLKWGTSLLRSPQMLETMAGLTPSEVRCGIRSSMCCGLRFGV